MQPAPTLTANATAVAYDTTVAVDAGYINL